MTLTAPLRRSRYVTTATGELTWVKSGTPSYVFSPASIIPVAQRCARSGFIALSNEEREKPASGIFSSDRQVLIAGAWKTQ
jgi:hypothetical protein